MGSNNREWWNKKQTEDPWMLSPDLTHLAHELSRYNSSARGSASFKNWGSKLSLYQFEYSATVIIYGKEWPPKQPLNVNLCTKTKICASWTPWPHITPPPSSAKLCWPVIFFFTNFLSLMLCGNCESYGFFFSPPPISEPARAADPYSRAAPERDYSAGNVPAIYSKLNEHCTWQGWLFALHRIPPPTKKNPRHQNLQVVANTRWGNPSRFLQSMANLRAWTTIALAEILYK